MKKIIICGLAAMLISGGANAFADAVIIPGNVDENNNITFTIKVDNMADADRNGMLTIFREEISKSDLKSNNFNKNQILLADIITMPANDSEITYTVNMESEQAGLYYARARIGNESIVQAFSYMDKAALDVFLDALAKNTTSEDMYNFFKNHKSELMMDIENDYTLYTEDEKKAALENVLSRKFGSVADVKQSFENGLLIVNINKSDEDEIKSIIENNISVFGIDISQTSEYSKLDENAGAAVWANMKNQGFKTVEQVKAAFDEAVNKNYIIMLLEKIKNSTADNVMDIFTDDAMKALGIEKDTGVYAEYINGTDKAAKKFAQLIAGSDWKADEAAKSFKEKSIIAAYQTLSDYIEYTNLINMTKTDLGLNGNYFSWNNDSSRYAVNKLMIANASALTSFDAIKASFNQYVSQTTDKSSSGSGGGTKISSSSGSVIGTVSTPTDNTSKQDDKDLSQSGDNIKFNDLAGYEWASESIYNLAKYSIVDGTENGKFEPERLIKKEELSKIIAEAFDIEVKDAYCNFNDVSKNTWYYDYVASLYSAEIVKGIGDSMFGTRTEVSREDMCVMIYNAIMYKGYNIPVKAEKINFRDAEHINAYAEKAVEQMQISGIVNGMDDNVFEPKTPANRAMAAVIIERALKLLGKI